MEVPAQKLAKGAGYHHCLGAAAEDEVVDEVRAAGNPSPAYRSDARGSTR
jgi:hypothetical protein